MANSKRVGKSPRDAQAPSSKRGVNALPTSALEEQSAEQGTASAKDDVAVESLYYAVVIDRAAEKVKLTSPSCPEVLQQGILAALQRAKETELEDPDAQFTSKISSQWDIGVLVKRYLANHHGVSSHLRGATRQALKRFLPSVLSQDLSDDLIPPERHDTPRVALFLVDMEELPNGYSVKLFSPENLAIVNRWNTDQWIGVQQAECHEKRDESGLALLQSPSFSRALYFEEEKRKEFLALTKPLVFSDAEPTAEGFQQFLTSMAGKCEDATLDERQALVRIVNFWRGELDTNFTFDGVPCTLKARKHSTGSDFQIRKRGKAATALVASKGFPLLEVLGMEPDEHSKSP